MTRPSDGDILRCLRGEDVFDGEADEAVRQAGAILPAGPLFAIAADSEDLETFVEALGRWAAVAQTGDVRFDLEDEDDEVEYLEEGEEDDLVPREQRITGAFRIRFVDEKAAFYMDWVWGPPALAIEYAKFRRADCHYWKVDVGQPSDLKAIESEAREFAFVTAVERISVDEFRQAGSSS